MEKLEIAGADRAVAHQRVEIDHLVPEFPAEQDDWHPLAHLAGLHERQDLEHLIERAEAAGKEHDRLRQINEPEFPHEEIVEMEMQLAADEGIVELLVRDRDGEADID